MRKRIISVTACILALLIGSVSSFSAPAEEISHSLASVEGAPVKFIGVDKLAIVDAGTKVSELKSALVDSDGVEVISPKDERILDDGDSVPSGSTVRINDVGFVTDTARAVVFGDSNSDGRVNTTDAICILRSIALWDIEIDSISSNLNGDNAVNTTDVIMILRKLAGTDVKIKEPEVETETVIQGNLTERFYYGNAKPVGEYPLSDGDIAVSFGVKYSTWLNSIGFSVKNGQSASDYKISLYKWLGKYSASVEKEPVISCTGNVGAGEEKAVTLDISQSLTVSTGHYLCVLSAKDSSLSVLKYSEKLDDGFFGYSDGKVIGDGAVGASLNITYANGFDIQSDANMTTMVNPVYTTVKIPGMTRTDTLIHLTDSHFTLAYDGEFDGLEKSDVLAQAAIDRTNQFTAQSDGLNTKDRFPYFLEYARQIGAKHILATGDMVDFASKANVDMLFGDYLANSGIGYTYCFGNHDWSFGDPSYYQTSQSYNNFGKKLFPDYMGGDVTFEARDMGEYVIVSLKNDDGSFMARHLKKLKEVSQLGKPIILMMHIPIHSPTLVDDTTAAWGSDITLNPGSLMSSYQLYEYMLTEESNVVAIFAGHLHFNHEDIVGDKIPQYITDASYNGGCRIITVTGE